ncbi:MAG: hypothetical protein ACYTGN_09260 [Planctomycetota bacterium]
MQVLGKRTFVNDLTWTLAEYELTLRYGTVVLKGSGGRDWIHLEKGRYRFQREEAWHARERRAKKAVPTKPGGP